MSLLTKLLSRRELFRGGSALAASASFRATKGAALAPSLRLGPDIYQSIGVRPIVNCQGDKTILGGSLVLPEVRRAMEEASRRFVHMDELMEAVGARLAELTGAEWGIVTSGCAAAITHATAACIAGADPEKLQRLPNLEGLKNEVVVPRFCRNVYDHAARMLGVRMIEVDTPEQLDAALSARTAMIYLFYPRGPLPLEVVSAIARKKAVPVFVDAAAEDLSIPNQYLQRGATLVAYSGGKILRGPQCAGLLLGRKDLVKAAFLNSAPHHAFGRPMKVGKEEVLGMLAAVEMWVRRDHDAERGQWESWLKQISSRVSGVPGVKTEIFRPDTPSGRVTLRISWDANQLGITGEELEKLLAQGDPRIITGRGVGSRPSNMASSITIAPFMMSPGEGKVVADRLFALLSAPPKASALVRPGKPASDVAGQWELQLEFVCDRTRHQLFLEQRGSDLHGTHRGQFVKGDLRGTIEGDEVRILSAHRIEGTWLHWDFTGKVEGNTMRGIVRMDEYGEANWTASRHQYRQPGNEPFIQPVKPG